MEQTKNIVVIPPKNENYIVEGSLTSKEVTIVLNETELNKDGTYTAKVSPKERFVIKLLSNMVVRKGSNCIIFENELMKEYEKGYIEGLHFEPDENGQYKVPFEIVRILPKEMARIVALINTYCGAHFSFDYNSKDWSIKDNGKKNCLHVKKVTHGEIEAVKIANALKSEQINNWIYRDGLSKEEAHAKWKAIHTEALPDFNSLMLNKAKVEATKKELGLN